MDYKEKYEMALEGIQEILSSGENSIKMSRLKLRLQPFFPELKESEDEKVRKAVIAHIKDLRFYDTYYSVTPDEMIAWLEKQKTKKNEWLFEKGKWYVKLQHHYEGDLRHFEKGHVYQALSEVEITDRYHNVSLGSWEIPEYFRPATKDEIPKETEQTSKLNEDEEIRNYFINAVKEQPNIHQEWKEKCLTWLEKQGEQNDSDVEDYNSIDPHFGKSIDKIEPNFNFKAGQWIVATGKRVYLITKIEGFNVTLVDTDGNEYVFDTSSLEDGHLWTIADAKEGDVLSYVTDEGDLWIMIYWSLYEPYEGHVHYHALLVNNNFSDKGTCCISIDNLKPATKEQRDLLFSKMKESGYEWDAERKELKIIDWSKHIKYNPNAPSIVKEKSIWNKEDGEMCQETIDWFEKKCFPYALENDNPARESIKWLKSLKYKIKKEAV